MYLKKIRLSGFKSFVDPTSIPISSRLIGVVGPNGCGKSNIIDAVRWVMGESSAKHLRGDSLADVIFSGSNARKPVGKASVELVFDNADGRITGQYAGFSEISIRREASRDGTSDYFINKAKCRKKDITDLFLGTGLGPRAYSIIEQGMVSRFIEAKPEELRGYLEEAAGISKYKERRRETENRIRHTRENLERVEDIRREMETQLDKLQRQSRAAAKYKELKVEERKLQGELLLLRWRKLDADLQEKDRQVAQKQNALEAIIARQREIEKEIESLRVAHTGANDNLNEVQERYYALGSQVSGIEQRIQHMRETREQQVREQQQLNQSWDEVQRHMEADRQLLQELDNQAQLILPQVQKAEQEYGVAHKVLQEAEAALHQWQEEWREYNMLAAEPEKIKEVQASRIQNLQISLEKARDRSLRLQEESNKIEEGSGSADISQLREQAETFDRRFAEEEAALEAQDASIAQCREELEIQVAGLDELRGEYRASEARLLSLQELQDAAEGRKDDALNNWLDGQGLRQAQRLSGSMQVEAGWEKAVEQLLGNMVNAVCVDRLESVAQPSNLPGDTALALVEKMGGNVNASPDFLLAKIKSNVDLGPWLAGAKTAADMDDALSRRGTLQAEEYFIVPSGSRVGKSWIQLAGGDRLRSGILARAREIEELESLVPELKQQVEDRQGEIERLRENIRTLQQQRDAKRQEFSELGQERGQINAKLAREEARLAQIQQRSQQLSLELEELSSQSQSDEAALAEAQRLLQEAERLAGSQHERRAELEGAQSELKTRLDEARADSASKRDVLHKLQIEQQRLQTTRETTEQALTRLQSQAEQLEGRRQELDKVLSEDDMPELSLKEQLEQLMQKQVVVEQTLQDARQKVVELDTQTRELEKGRNEQEGLGETARDELGQIKVIRQEVVVRRDTIGEKIDELHLTREAIAEQLPEDADPGEWQEKVEKMERRISRLGPINLVAIEEYEEQSERKAHLDKQYNDLSEALNTLEQAISKIDRETRTRFKETFDKVNTGFQAFFPRLFGGGHAYLDLTGEDLLETGVTVMARPPGKRNSTIHLLSGGEKALTAVALIFSIFQLNPAPFCLLDEVDAPLDDANVERYCQTLKTIAGDTQLLFVTHNKVTMETAELLLGVTMSEPGVSRLVAVDVDEALEMVV